MCLYQIVRRGLLLAATCSCSCMTLLNHGQDALFCVEWCLSGCLRCSGLWEKGGHRSGESHDYVQALCRATWFCSANIYLDWMYESWVIYSGMSIECLPKGHWCLAAYSCGQSSGSPFFVLRMMLTAKYLPKNQETIRWKKTPNLIGICSSPTYLL